MNSNLNGWKRGMIGGLAALGVVAGSSLLVAPQEAHAYTYETSRLLYAQTFPVGSGQGERLRLECLTAAPAYHVTRTEAQVIQTNREHAVVNELLCYGYTAHHFDLTETVRIRAIPTGIQP